MKKLNSNNRRGFTLVELAVVVLIIGIIAAIAAPRFFDTVDDASDAAAIQSLTVIRDSVELHRANNTAYPGEANTSADFVADLALYLRGSFPTCPVGNKNNSVRVQTTGTALAASGTEGWCFDNKTGEFRINHASYITK